MLRPLINIVRLPRVPIYQQLCLEEALFYQTNDNWWLYNDGSESEPPTVVLGISGKPEKMCDLDVVRRDGIPLIRRFSGGGTVVVDRNTIFATLIMRQKDAPECPPFPRDIMAWSTELYQPAFDALTGGKSSLELRENDYVFGDHKFAGNAQAITRDRWLHHTSFLWSYDPEVMACLQLPERRPEYRLSRPHSKFLTPLREHITDAPAAAGALGGRERVFAEMVRALSMRFRVADGEEGAATAAAVIENLGGAEEWAQRCRTKFVEA